jgi:hypothetical protein
MNIDIAAAAYSAVDLLRDQFLLEAGKEVAKSAGRAIGKKVAGWFKSKFTETSDAGTLSKFEADPNSVGARNMLAGALQMRLERDTALMQELVALLKEASTLDPSLRQIAAQIGSDNTSAQVVGSGNTVTLGKK